MTRKEELEAQRAKIVRELNKIYDAEAIERHRAQLGKCFKYHNGDGKKRWWSYAKVIKADTSMTAFTFEMLPDGTVNIETESYWAGTSYGWKPTTSETFEAEWNKVVAHIGNLEV